MKSKLLLYTFRMICLSIFLYQASICLDHYKNQGVASKTEFVNQENYPRPLICLTSEGFSHRTLQDTGTISYRNYSNGSWRIGDLTEEETFDFVAANISDLISTIRIDKQLGPIGNKYERLYFPVNEMTNFTLMGIQIVRKDYYVYLKTFCLNMSSIHYPYGISGLYIGTRTLRVTVVVVPPGMFYDGTRYTNVLEIDPRNEYAYAISYAIYKKLIKNENCNLQLDWKEDNCKLSKLLNNMISELGCITPWLISFARNYGLRSPQQYQICKENSSFEAASFQFENRYTAYEECTNPCKSLKVTTNLKYKRKSDKNQKSGQVKFYFPREIQITEEIVVKSLLTLVAEIGGYLGMTLGVNLLDLEAIFRATYSTIHSYILIKSISHNVINKC